MSGLIVIDPEYVPAARPVVLADTDTRTGALLTWPLPTPTPPCTVPVLACGVGFRESQPPPLKEVVKPS